MLRAPVPVPGLPFTATAHNSWASGDDRTLVAAWHESTGALGTAWQSDDDGIAVVAGQVRGSAAPWDPARRWAAVLRAELTRAYAVGDPAADLGGLFAGVVLDGHGRGTALTDPLSLRYLYWSRGATWTIVASNPHLAAWAAAAPGERPHRDALGVCSLAATGHRLMHYCGYESVELLRPGSRVAFHPGNAPVLVHRDAAWWPSEAERQKPREVLLDRAAAAIAESVAASLTYPTGTITADLTGGRDSRLILAGALLAGVTDQLLFTTTGPATLPDVVIARELADLTGVAHLSGADLGSFQHAHGRRAAKYVALGLSFAQERQLYVEVTAGMDNIWQSFSPSAGDGSVNLSGLFGEALRSMLRWELPTVDLLIEQFDRRIGKLRLLRPDVHMAIRSRIQEDLLRNPAGANVPFEDLHDWHRIEMQIRRNFGPREDAREFVQHLPLYAMDALTASFALGPRARMVNDVHRGVLERASPSLASHRFVDSRWPTVRMKAPPIRGPLADIPAERGRKASFSVGGSKSLGKIIIAKQREARIELLHDLLADTNNRAWDFIDDEHVRQRLGSYGQLTTGQQLEMLGAATAALWLSTPD